MKPEVYKMIENMYKLLFEKFKNKQLAWNRLIEFIAVDNNGALFLQLNHKFEFLFEDKKLLNSLMDIYNSKLISSDNINQIGDLYNEICN